VELIGYITLLAYFIYSIVIALIYSKKARKSTNDFFLSSSKLLLFLARIKMVVTNFAVVTPLAVTELVANNSIFQN